MFLRGLVLVRLCEAFSRLRWEAESYTSSDGIAWLWSGVITKIILNIIRVVVPDSSQIASTDGLVDFHFRNGTDVRNNTH